MLTPKSDLSGLKAQLAQMLNLPETAKVSLPPTIYGSERVHELEVENIFRKEWVCLGRADEVHNPGDYFTTDLVGEPLVVTRSEDGNIHVLSNVCRHRWSSVAQGKGNAKVLVCPYHAWTYRHDGQLIGAPFMDETAGFDKKNYSLHKVRNEIWHGFIFATFNPDIESVADRLSRLQPLVANYGMGEMKKFTGADEIWNTNWKLLAENFTEAYHTFHTHKDSLEHAVPSELTVFREDDHDEHFSAFLSPFGPTEQAREPCSPTLTQEERTWAVLVSLFPSLVFALAPDRVFYMCLTPLSAGQVKVRWGVSSYGEEFTNTSIKEISRFYDIVNKEDKIRLETIQLGVHSRFATQSNLSWLESTNVHFGRYVAKRIFAAM